MNFVSPRCRQKYQVSLAEFKRWLEANGAARSMADEDVEALFNSVDVDHSGTVGADEIDPWLLRESTACDVNSCDAWMPQLF